MIHHLLKGYLSIEKVAIRFCDSVFRGNLETRAQTCVNASANVIVEVAIRLRTRSNKTVRFVVVVGKVRGARLYVCLHACCDSQVLSFGMAFEFIQTYLYSSCCPQVYFMLILCEGSPTPQKWCTDFEIFRIYPDFTDFKRFH